MDRSDCLSELIIKHNCQRIVEIGMGKGNNCKKILSNPDINNIISEYWGIEISSVRYTHVIKYMPFFPQLKILNLSSEKAAQIFANFVKKYSPDGFFDLVFIDANHSYKSVKQDIILWEPLLKKGGLLTGHDYYGGPDARNPGVKKAVDEIIGAENINVLPDVMWVRK